jgi:hypothetical protein
MIANVGAGVMICIRDASASGVDGEAGDETVGVMAAWAFTGGVKRWTTPPAGAATWLSFTLAWLAASMAMSPSKAFTGTRERLKATVAIVAFTGMRERLKATVVVGVTVTPTFLSCCNFSRSAMRS